jgi:TPR repeat protein
MGASQDMKSKTARVSEKIESAIRSAIKYYEEQHDLEWCDGSYDADEIKEAAEMLLSAKDAEVCICIGYSLGYSTPESLGDCISEEDHRTSRIHLHGNAVAFTVDLKEPGSCTNHENVLIPQVDPLSKGKTALLEGSENGNASAMFALSRLFDQGIGEPQDPIEAYFWYFSGNGVLRIRLGRGGVC